MNHSQKNSIQEKQTRIWLKDVVIGLNLCPFAHPFFEQELIGIDAGPHDQIENNLERYFKQLESGTCETLLLIVNNLPRQEFAWFYAFVQDLQESVERLRPHTYHLIAFHPEFCFEGLESDDKANYVNRSPYPTIHILKRAHLDRLNLATDQGEKISRINEEKLKSLDENKFKALFSFRD